MSEPVVKTADVEAVNAAAYETYLSDTAEPESAKSFDIIRDGFDGASADYFSIEQRVMLQGRQIKATFFSEDWVFILVNLMAQMISNQKLSVVKVEVVDGERRVEPAVGHPVQARLDAPNRYQDYASYMYCVVVDESIGGNSIVWRADYINSLIPLPFETIRLNFDSNYQLASYMVQQWSDMQGSFGANPTMVIPAQQIIHVRRPNPSSLLWGLPPMVPAEKAVNFNRYSTEYLNAFYEKGATPQMALSMDKDANEKNALRLLRSFEQAYVGRRNQRRTMVLPRGVTATSMTQTLADQQLIEHIDTNRETLMNVWGVPKHALSLAESGSLGSEEAKQAMKNFWMNSLIPVMKRIAGAHTKAFADMLGPGYLLEFDLSDIEVLREDELKKALLAKEMLAVHSPNEVRAQLYKLGPIAGGETLAPANAGAGLPMSPPGVPHDPSQGKAITVDAKAGGAVETVQTIAPAGDDGAKAARKAFATKLKQPGNWFEKRHTALETQCAPKEHSIRKLALDHFVNQAEAGIKAVKAHLKQKNYAPHRIKAEGEDGGKKPNVPSVVVPNRSELKKSIKSAFQSFEEQWVGDSVKVLMGAADIGYGVQLQVPFKLPDQAAIEALGVEGAAQRRAILEDRELKTFAWMDDTTTEKIMQIVEDGVSGGATIQKIAANIADSFKDIENIESRAATIARTEVLTAASLGQAAAMDDMAKVIPDLTKVWIATHDDRTRPEHAEIDGDRVPYDEPFANGLMFPRDPAGEASSVINCRCGWAALPKDYDE